jgi:F-type H+-transporting ATPase subunit epsilon
MADTLEFELVWPERLLMSEPVEMVVVPGSEGDFGVLPGHAPFITTVRPGVITIYADKNPKQRIFVAGGFAEANSTRCTVLADEAIALSDIDRAEVDARLASAREAVTDARDDGERAAAQERLAVAETLAKAVAAHGGGCRS